MLPSTPHIMWPNQIQSLKLLRLTVKEEMHLQKNTLFDLKVAQYVAQYPLLQVTYSGTKFEDVTYNGLGGDAFTRKYSIWPRGQGHAKCCPVPSTSGDLNRYKVWRCYV